MLQYDCPVFINTIVFFVCNAYQLMIKGIQRHYNRDPCSPNILSPLPPPSGDDIFSLS